MGKNINNINNPVVVTPDEALIYLGVPGGTNVDPFTDATTKAIEFKAPLQSQIDDNETDILANATDIVILQNNSSKRLDTSQSSSYSFTQDADSLIEQMFFKGTGTVSVGISSGGDELMSSRLITGGLRIGDISASIGYTETSRTIYITLSAASVDVATFSKLSLFTS